MCISKTVLWLDYSGRVMNICWLLLPPYYMRFTHFSNAHWCKPPRNPWYTIKWSDSNVNSHSVVEKNEGKQVLKWVEFVNTALMQQAHHLHHIQLNAIHDWKVILPQFCISMNKLNYNCIIGTVSIMYSDMLLWLMLIIRRFCSHL